MGSSQSQMIVEKIVFRTLLKLEKKHNGEYYYTPKFGWRRLGYEEDDWIKAKHKFKEKDLQKVLKCLDDIQIQGYKTKTIYNTYNKYIQCTRDPDNNIINEYTKPLLYYYFVEIVQESGFSYESFPNQLAVGSLLREKVYLGWLMHNLVHVTPELLDNKEWGHYYYWFTVLSCEQRECNKDLIDNLLNCKWLQMGDIKVCKPILHYFCENTNEVKIIKILNHPNYKLEHREWVCKNSYVYIWSLCDVLCSQTPFSDTEVKFLSKKCNVYDVKYLVQNITESQHLIMLKHLESSLLTEENKPLFPKEIRLIVMKDRLMDCYEEKPDNYYGPKEYGIETMTKFVEFIIDCDRDQLLGLSNDLLSQGKLKAAQILQLKMQQNILKHQDNQFDRIADLVIDNKNLIEGKKITVR